MSEPEKEPIVIDPETGEPIEKGEPVEENPEDGHPLKPT